MIKINKIFTSDIMQLIVYTNHSRYSHIYELPCDVYVTNSGICVELEIPSLDIDTLKIDLLQNTLRVSGVKKNFNITNVHAYYLRAERLFGIFKKYVELPSEVNNIDKISYNNGILKIILKQRS